MEFVVQGSRRNRKFCEALLPSLISQLKLTNSRKTLMVSIAAEDGKTHCGYTMAIPGLEAYVIVIKPVRRLKEIGLTLAHEMVHVSQMASGLLKPAGRGAQFWAGKRYAKNTPYLDQPWEQNAFARTELLFRRAIDS